MGSLLTGLKWDALLLAARPSFRSGSSTVSPEPGPGGPGHPGRLPSRQAAGAANRLGPSYARGFAAAPPPPLFRTRSNAHRPC